MYDYSFLRCTRSPDLEPEYWCAPGDPNICVPCTRLAQRITANLVHWEHNRRILTAPKNHIHPRPLPHLPSELLAEIFLFCVPADSMAVDLAHASPRAIYAPLTLSAVCARWAAIAHTLPPLWATLFLCTGVEARGGRLRLPRLARAWIARAGRLPLSVSLYISADCCADTARTLLVLLFSHSTRLRALKYHGPPAWFSSVSKGKDEFPQLRTLHLLSSDTCHTSTFALHPAQRLTTLSLRKITLAAVTFAYHSLTSLEVASASTAECLACLRRLPNLTEYTLTAHPEPEPPLTPVTHHSLEHLRIVFLGGSLLHHVLCPSLTTLALDTHGEPEVQWVVDFLARSGCALKSLRISGDIRVPDIDALCLGIPTLQHLHLSAPGSALTAARLFARLAERSSVCVDGMTEPRYLGCLRSLAFSLDLSTGFLDWALLSAIFGTTAADPKKRSRHALESVDISLHRCDAEFDQSSVFNIDEEALRRILWLRETGVKWKIALGPAKEDAIQLFIDHYKMQATSTTVRGT